MQFNEMETYNFEGKVVLVRLDLNVPLSNGKILDENRIQAALPTIEFLKKQKAKIALMSHLGRPKGKKVKELSLTPVGERLAELLNCEILMVNDYDKEPADQVLKQLGMNQIVLFENLRFHAGETKNSKEFAEILAKGVDYYVNDAFGAAHRAHSSVSAVANILGERKCFPGFLIKKEIKGLDVVKNKPKNPFTVIIGGAKVTDKIGVILSLLEHCNNLLVGGAMAYTLLKYKGINVGSSRVEEDKMDLAEAIFRNAESRKVNIQLPIDHVCAESFSENASPQDIKTSDIPNGLMGLDIGVQTQKLYGEIIEKSATVLWNGPMGVFEWDPYSKGTFSVARSVAQCNGYSVVGGGESVAAVRKAKVSDNISHVSTGGGAALEYLEGIQLPGIKVLELS